MSLGQTEETARLLSDAMQIYTSAPCPNAALVAETHFHAANCCLARGDLKKALEHAQCCRKARESLYGQNDPRSVEAFRQTATLLMAPYRHYRGVLTPVIRQAYREAIACHEKVFRYLKTVKRTKGKLNHAGGLGAVPEGSADVPTARHPSLTMTEFWGSADVPALCGPLVASPFIPVEHISRALLHKLTKEIVSLKLALIESPCQREVVRLQKLLNRERTGTKQALDSDTARTVILRLAAVSPSVYLDALLARIEDEDWTAQEELGSVLQLIESDTIQA
jgi:hypothetical protein